MLLTACGSEANHLGNPLTLPIHGATTAISNAAYQARRDRVSSYLSNNRSAIQAEAQGTPGTAFSGLMQVARIPETTRPLLHRDIAEIATVQGADWVERATVIAMVHSN